ncbi:urea amidolyase associated protein UAAP1 [Teredinibacter franksiae]|uniref:urea amidolyase associated protein UAAP1 n=1 Tax=Teredinibacter franksiae TaxID=2761453 RepID=UPI001629479E|nr:urea amidolyase associated protein UAAP1 [Teredinibacter franksiae]
MTNPVYSYTLPPASHWSLKVRKGTLLKLTDIEGGGNLGIMFYNPENLLERYNAPDTLKCQHTFKLTTGNCLYSDMGRIFCSIVADDHGWHETVSGNSTVEIIKEKWGELNYQQARNEWQQNGFNSFLVELAKYGMNERDMVSNLNCFSKVEVDRKGNISLAASSSPSGTSVSLRFEMDTLIVMHSCPHPLSTESVYPRKPVLCEFFNAKTVYDNDLCINHCNENKRGFDNNRLYHMGMGR